jgi:hypothetical protein
MASPLSAPNTEEAEAILGTPPYPNPYPHPYHLFSPSTSTGQCRKCQGEGLFTERAEQAAEEEAINTPP